MASRITENLFNESLNFTYPGDKLKEAIESGEFAKEIQVCADTLYGGDFEAACAAARKTWQSLACNARKDIKAYGAIGIQGAKRVAKLERAEMLLKYVGGKCAAKKAAKTAKDGKAFWLYTVEEIEAIPLEDLDKLSSVRNNMATKLCHYPDAIEEIMPIDEYRAIYKVACDRRSKANALAKQRAQGVSPSVSPETTASAEKFVAKLQNGGKLTAKDKATLAAVLAELMGKSSDDEPTVATGAETDK